MTLAEMIAQLLREGATEQEALEVATATLKARRGGTASMQRMGRTAEDRKFSASAQDYDNGVDYGDETAEQAKDRWLRQEMNDPNGLFMGGATMGGVFGDGAIPMADYDPMAVHRAVQMKASVQQLSATQEMLKLLGEMRQQQRELPPREDPPPPRLAGFSRFLGKKRG